MKNTKLMLAMLVAVVTVMFAGCSATNNIKVTEDGQGRQEVKFAIDKSTYGEEFVKVSSIDDIAKILRSNITNKNITITTDTKSSKTKDYIIASVEYNSLEEMDNILKNMGLEIAELEMNEDAFDIDIDVEQDAEEEEDAYITVIKEYFSTNGIAYNAESEGFKKFVKAFEKAMEFDCDEEYDLEGFEEEFDAEIDEMFEMFDMLNHRLFGEIFHPQFFHFQLKLG